MRINSNIPGITTILDTHRKTSKIFLFASFDTKMSTKTYHSEETE